MVTAWSLDFKMVKGGHRLVTMWSSDGHHVVIRWSPFWVLKFFWSPIWSLKLWSSFNYNEKSFFKIIIYYSINHLFEDLYKKKILVSYFLLSSKTKEN